jgi:hypothetical protein
MTTERTEPDEFVSESVPSRPRMEQRASSGWSTVDQMSECSFPASDPPAVWTWEVSDKPDRRSRGGGPVPEHASRD